MRTVRNRKHLAAAVVVLLCWCSLAGHTQAPNDAADVGRLVEILRLRDGSVVADIGAGSGPLSIGMAPHVGRDGRVYSTDLDAKRLQEIRDAVAHAGLQNVTVVEGGSSRTNLPEGSCDAIFMRDVYHHFARPADMDGSLYRTLKPGGRIAVVDFVPKSGRTAPPGKRDQGADHGILPADVIQELKAAGFEGVQEVAWPSPGYFVVVGQRPPS